MAPNTTNRRNQPSSFPGIYKYPTKRDELFTGNALDWIAAKRIDDDIGDLWRVHDKLYNLEDFIHKHPGGSDWISVTRGTDITEAFEASHIVDFGKVESILHKYYVRPASSPRMSPYTFKEDGFYKTLKRKVEPILKEVGTGPTLSVRVLIDTIFISWVVIVFLGLRLDSRPLQILSGFILALGVIASHNFFHIRENWRRFYWDVGLLSSYEWRISHALSHHLYANTLMDAEISMFEPVMEFLPKKDKNWLQRYGVMVYAHLLYWVMFFSSFLTRWKKVLMGEQPFRSEYLLNLVELVVCMFLSPTLMSGVLAWMLMQSAFSFLFLLIGVNAAHHHPDIFHDGDEARPDPDFGLCQLDAVRDRVGTPHENLFVQMVTFGEHSLHHLFPTVCHSKLHHLKGAYAETLREFSEQFPGMTQWELYLGCLKQLARTEPKRRQNKKAQ